MTFLTPWLLLGLLAAAVPLAIHLRRSRRSTKIEFSTTRFFDEKFIRASKRAQLQDLIVMFLRMALLALLALALAQPLIRWPALSGLVNLAGDRRQVVIVLDDSASMGLTSEKGILLDRAKKGALAVANELSTKRGDKATVILAGRRDDGARALFEELSFDLAAVKDAISNVRITDLGTDLESAIERAASVLGESGEIYVFSDLQEPAFVQAEPINPGATLAVFFVSTRDDVALRAAQVSVHALQIGSARPMSGVPFTFRAAVKNHGDQPRSIGVRLVVGDQTLSRKTVEVAPKRREMVRFVHRFTEPGWFTGRIELEGNQGQVPWGRRHFAVEVKKGLRIGALNGAPSTIPGRDELFFFRAALGGAGQDDDATIVLDTLMESDLQLKTLQTYGLIVMANVPGLSDESLSQLEHYVDGGGNLFIALGDRIDLAQYNQWVGEHRLHGGLMPGTIVGLVGSVHDEDLPAAREEGGFIATVDSSHAGLGGFADGSLGSLTSVRFSARYGIDSSSAGVIMSASSGDPLLVEKLFGRGRVMLFASALDRDWSNFPLQPAFVPFIHRLVSSLSQPSVQKSNFVRTGQSIELAGSTTRFEPLRIRLPHDEVAYPEPDPVKPGSLTFARTERAGPYFVLSTESEQGSSTRAAFAANVPSGEADLRYLGRSDLEGMMHEKAAWTFIEDSESVTTESELARTGMGLWDQLLVLALLIGLVEPWIANRLSRRRLASSRSEELKTDSGSTRPGKRAAA